MSQARFLRYFVLALAPVVVGTEAFAKASETLDIPFSASLSGTKVEAGRYRIDWNANSPEATVTLSKGKTVVATAEAKLVERDTRARRTAVVYKTKADGTEMISEIRFQGSSQALVFSE